MSRRKAAAAVLAVTAVAGAGVAVGVFLTHGTQGAPGTSAGAPPTATTPGPVAAPPDTGGLDEVSAEPTASIGPDPDAGEPVATDEPVTGTGDEATVTLTFAGWVAGAQEVQVDGFVPGVAEDGGNCTLRLTKDGRTVTDSTAAVADAGSTACGGLAVPGSALSPGTWQAVLAYESAGRSGTSGGTAVEVPR